MADKLHHPRIQTGLREYPVTLQRPLYNPPPGEPKTMVNMGTARANKATTPNTPNGTPGWAEEHTHQTVLQQHIDFFDPDRDGQIWPLDTFWGFYALGFNLFLSIFAVFVVHGTFSYATCPGLLPDPFFRVYIRNIHKGKHASDSGMYDTEGRFVPQKFEDWIAKYGKGKDGITLGDIWDAHKGQRCIADPIGWTAEFLEWGATYIMLWPDDGVMKKEDLRRVIDGSILYEIAEKRTGTKNPRSNWRKYTPRKSVADWLREF